MLLVRNRLCSFFVCFLFCEIELLFDEATIGFDHVGKEGENDKLDSDNEEERGKKEIVSIGRNFEILNIENEEDAKQEKCDADEGEAGDAEKLHRTNVPYGFYDDA